MKGEAAPRSENRYSRIIERIFLSKYVVGDREVAFVRRHIEDTARDLGIELPKNLGDVIYSFRYRTALPSSVSERAPQGESWLIQPAGRARYKFVAATVTSIIPNRLLPETKVPDSTPGVIAVYAMSDEQALLARVRYNRLIDIFTGVACYSLQNHLRTSIAGIGQVETDEIYIGIDRRGVHYVFPVQAKGGNDLLSVVQIGQDIAMCAAKFPTLLSRPIAPQFIGPDLIVLFSFGLDNGRVVQLDERHYRLVPPEEITPGDLQSYRLQPVPELN